jgi:hypothetical protein
MTGAQTTESPGEHVRTKSGEEAESLPKICGVTAMNQDCTPAEAGEYAQVRGRNDKP